MESVKSYHKILILILIFGLILFFLFSGKCPNVCKNKESFTNSSLPLSVMGITRDDDTYYADKNITSSPNWTKIDGKLRWISHSNGKAYGINRAGDVFYNANYKTGNWVKVPGQLMILSFDGYNNIVMGLNRFGATYYANKNIESNPNWTEVSRPGGLSNISYSNKQAYGVLYLRNSPSKIYYNDDYTSKNWVEVGNKFTDSDGTEQVIYGLTHISFDGYNNILMGVTFGGDIFYANQNIKTNPNWRQIPGRLRMLAYSNKQFYGVNNSGDIFYSSDYSSGNLVQIGQFDGLQNISFEDSSAVVIVNNGCNLGDNFVNGMCIAPCNPGDTLANGLCIKPCPYGAADGGINCSQYKPPETIWNGCAIQKPIYGGQYQFECHGGWTTLPAGTTLSPKETYYPKSYAPSKSPILPSISSLSSSAVPPPFTTSGELIGWYDGNDPLANGSLPTNGATINTWFDKSPSKNKMIAKIPGTYDNDSKSINFNSSWYQAENSIYTYPIDVYMVVKLNSLTTPVDVFGYGQRASDNFNSLTFGEFKPGVWHNGSTNFKRTPNAVANSVETSTNFLLINWSIANNNFHIYRNGEKIMSSTAYRWDPQTPYFQLGNRLNVINDNLFKGKIAEVMIFTTRLDDIKRKNIESLLTKKWGIGTPPSPPPPSPPSPPTTVPPPAPINNSCNPGDNLDNGFCTTPCQTGWVDTGVNCTLSKLKTTYAPVDAPLPPAPLPPAPLPPAPPAPPAPLPPAPPAPLPPAPPASSAPPYDNDKVYNLGDVVSKDGKTYKMIDGIGAPGYPPPRPTNWLEI